MGCRYRTALFLAFATAGVSPALTAEPAPGLNAGPLQQAAADYAKGDLASAWFRYWALAQQGSAFAQFNLGQLYRLGQGIPVDLQRARYWYAEAASRGNGEAQLNLGLMFEHGHGTPVDLTEARAWYRRAAAQNIPAAQEALQRIERQPRSP